MLKLCAARRDSARVRGASGAREMMGKEAARPHAIWRADILSENHVGARQQERFLERMRPVKHVSAREITQVYMSAICDDATVWRVAT